MIRKKNRLYKAYKRHGYQIDDKIRLDNLRLECHNAIEAAKHSYMASLGNKLHSSHSKGKIGRF